MTATPQAIEFAVNGYQDRNKKSREKAVKESGSYIAESYISQLEEILGKVVEKISSQKGFDELSPEDQAKVMEPQLYIQIAGGLMELDSSEKALDDYEKALRRLNRLLAKKLITRDDEGNYSISRDAFIKLYGTEENYKKIAFALKVAEAQSKYRKA